MSHLYCLVSPGACVGTSIAKATLGNLFDALTNWILSSVHWFLAAAGQIALPGAAGNFSQQNHVLSFDGAYDINSWVTLGSKYAFRIGQIRDNTFSGPWLDNQTHLLIGRIDYHLVKEWDVMGELRVLANTAAKDMKTGALVGVYRHLNDNFKIGAGYSFSDYSDDLTNLSTNNRGVFVNAIGKF